MSEPLLNIFKLCLLALLYLFFLRVLRAVWVEMRDPKPVPAADPSATTVQAAPATPQKPRRAPKSATPTQLKVLEPVEQKGRMFDLGDEITVGRAAGCQISLDDRFISQLHARVFRRDAQVFVEDLGSTNGTFVNGTKVTAPVLLAFRDRIKVGNIVLELQ